MTETVQETLIRFRSLTSAGLRARIADTSTGNALEEVKEMETLRGRALIGRLAEDLILAALVEAAMNVRAHAYASYSGFAVGAALRTDRTGGRIFAGANVEDVIQDGTHAEEAAIAVMIAAIGCTPKALLLEVAVACLAIDGETHALPCGKCRQKLLEHGDDRTVVYGARLDARGEIIALEIATLGELFPHAFGPGNLGR